MSRSFFRNSSREKKKSKIKRLSPLASLIAAGLGSAALALRNPLRSRPTLPAQSQRDTLLARGLSAPARSSRRPASK